jgi:outer membrane protein OmpA-like peptidoglycan-associated protein
LLSLILIPFIFSGCSVLPRETRYDENTTTYSSPPPGVKSTQAQGERTKKYSQAGDPRTITYTSPQPGVKSTRGQYEDATAYYTLRKKSAGPPRSEVIREKAPTATQQDTGERIMVLEVSDVLFDFDKAVIKTDYVPELEKWVEYFKENPEATAEILGHADSVGTVEYNQDLSERRARAVVKYLVDRGVEEDRLRSSGFGETMPAASNATSEGRQKNRRVEMKY